MTKRSLSAACLILLLASAVPRAQEGVLTRGWTPEAPPATGVPPRSPAADVYRDVSASQLVALAESTLPSGERTDKRRLLQAITERVTIGSPRFARAEDRPMLMQLVPTLTRTMVGDADEWVRRAALVARVQLEYGLAHQGAFGVELTESLASRYFDEASAPVRVEIVRSLALADPVEAVGSRETTLLAALADPSVDAVRFAAQGLGRLGASEALPALLSLLDDPDDRLRISVSASLAQFSTAALAPHLSRLQQSVATDHNEVVRATIRTILNRASDDGVR